MSTLTVTRTIHVTTETELMSEARTESKTFELRATYNMAVDGELASETLSRRFYSDTEAKSLARSIQENPAVTEVVVINHETNRSLSF